MIVSHVVASLESLSSRTVMESVPSLIEFVWGEVPSAVERHADENLNLCRNKLYKHYCGKT